ncbi:hypothetical protein [Helicobacter sp. MIT 01-3238]|uniref:hypothetical protein n=1 Tax=Helicobacter sp. MIT 01-3238 TaxID=398627 RepID=UPI000E1E7A74|nr:hypothetical protein [Helicobacter sp. MIT 01-3238]RDU51648.1 hypothetical protein CQA40_09480 [Helicobacter sp. MIT 01-3238]
MGILEKDKLHKVEPKKFKEKQIIFAKSEYFSAKIEGKQFFQLGTFGEKGDNEGQTIRFDRDTAIFLIDVLIKEFDLQADIKVSFK